MTIKQALFRGLRGVPIGISIMTTIVLVYSLIYGRIILTPPVNYTTSPLAAFTIQYFASCIVGFVFGVSSLIYEVEYWSIAKQTFVHFIITSSIFLPISLLCRWVQPKLIPIIIYFSMFIAIYVTIWLVNYLSFKHTIQKLNEELIKK
jgi:hypothetical protein